MNEMKWQKTSKVKQNPVEAKPIASIESFLFLVFG